MKKGDLTSKQLVIIIIIVVSFAVILLFIFYYPWTGTIDKETCHQSVVMRSTFNYGAFEPGKTIPLRCKTEKICLTAGAGCDDVFGKSSGKNPVTEIKVKDKKDVLEAISNAMYDCHSMLGEGKLDFMNHEFTRENYCLICSRFVLDAKAREKVGGIAYGELYKYLQDKKTPQGKSYLEYLYPGWTDWKNSEKLFENLQKESKNEEFKKMKFEDWKIDLNFGDGYTIIAQMAPKGTWSKWLEIGGVAVGGIVAVVGIASIPISGPIGAAIAVAGAKVAVGAATVVGGAIYMYDHPSGEYEWIPPSIFPYDVDSLNGLKCSSFETAP